MAERAEQVEQFAHKMWSLRSDRDESRMAEQCGYRQSELDRLKWDALPEKVKDYIRDIAEKEVAFMHTLPPPGEVEQYLTTLFRELERKRPAIYAATSHGIAWDYDWERLVLLVVLGDCVYPHPLIPGDLTSDPFATAENLWAKVEPAINNPDIDVIGFKG